ncbi:MAG: hypothetical protein ACK5ZB_02350, partial [bacterium]
RISGAAHGFAGEYKLHFVREKLPIGGLHGFGPFTQPFWQGRGGFNAVEAFVTLEKLIRSKQKRKYGKFICN